MIYMLVEGPVFSYIAVDCIEDGFLKDGGVVIFRITAVNCTEDYFIQVVGGSNLQLYCRGLY